MMRRWVGCGLIMGWLAGGGVAHASHQYTYWLTPVVETPITGGVQRHLALDSLVSLGASNHYLTPSWGLMVTPEHTAFGPPHLRLPDVAFTENLGLTSSERGLLTAKLNASGLPIAVTPSLTLEALVQAIGDVAGLGFSAAKFITGPADKIPTGYILTRPTGNTVLLRDTFDRASNDALGGDWVEDEDDFDIDGTTEMVECGTTNCNAGHTAHNTASLTSNYFMAYDDQSGTGLSTFVMLHKPSATAQSARWGYIFYFENGDGSWRIFHWRNNTETQVATSGTGLSRATSPQRMMFSVASSEVSPLSLEGFENGTSVLSTTHAFSANSGANTWGYAGFHTRHGAVAGSDVVNEFCWATTQAEAQTFSDCVAAAVENRIPAVLGNPAIF